MKKIFLSLSLFICSFSFGQIGQLHLNTAPWTPPTSIVASGDSYTAFFNPCTAPSSYLTQLAAQWGLSVSANYALSSTGIHYSDSILNANLGNNNAFATSVMIGFNDVRSITFDSDPGFRMLSGGYNSIFAAHFLKNSAFAGNGTGVTRTGTWTATANTGAFGGKAGAHGATTATLNDSITYVNPSADSSILVSLIGLSTGGANFDLYLDNILVGHLSENSRCHGLTDGHGYDNVHNPYVIMFTGLPLAVHKLKLVNTSAATTFYVDYFGELRSAASATPLIMWHSPINDATGNATTPTGAFYGVAQQQRLNRLIDSVAGTWNQNYPFFIIPTDKFLDTLSGICSSDHIHPNATGETQLFNAGMSVLPSLTSGFNTNYNQGARRLNAAINTVPHQVAYLDEVLTKGDASKFILNSPLAQHVYFYPGIGSSFVIPSSFLQLPIDLGAAYWTAGASIRQGDLTAQSNDAGNNIWGYNLEVISGGYVHKRAAPAAGLFFSGTTPSAAIVTAVTGLAASAVTFIVPISWQNGTPTSSLAAPTTAGASYNMAEGVNPTSPANGDHWTPTSDHNERFRSNGVTYILAKTLTNTGVLDFPSTGAGAISDLTITVTGAAVGDVVSLGIDNASLTTTASFTAWVSASNTVTVRYSPKATEDPASGTFRASILKY